MANLFCCDIASGSVTNLGVAASVLEHRRYGYQFGDAVPAPTVKSSSAKTIMAATSGSIFQKLKAPAAHPDTARGLGIGTKKPSAIIWSGKPGGFVRDADL